MLPVQPTRRAPRMKPQRRARSPQALAFSSAAWGVGYVRSPIHAGKPPVSEGVRTLLHAAICCSTLVFMGLRTMAAQQPASGNRPAPGDRQATHVTAALV